MSKNYVLHSTQESRDNQTTSVLAIVETIFFVALTWGIAYYYDFYTHIYTAIAIAPFLLLRTPASTDKAIEWFLHESKLDEKHYYRNKSFWILLTITILFSSLISYFFSIQILVQYEGWKLFFISMILGIIIVGVGVGLIILGVVGVVGGIGGGIVGGVGGIIGVGIGGIGIIGIVGVVIGGVGGVIVLEVIEGVMKNKFYILLSSPFILIFGALFGLISFLKSIIIKFIITLFYAIKHPINTFFNISKNWNEHIAINDVLYSPELLPEIHKKDSIYQLSNILSSFKGGTFLLKVLYMLIIPIWSLGYLYRFSIKSTAWFFFPLAYLANLNALQNKDKKNKAIKTQTWKKLFWFNVMISAVLFLYFKFTGQYLDLLGLSDIQLNFITQKMTQLRQYFIPEAMWLLVIAVILYFIMNTIISRQEHIEDKKYHMSIYWLIKLIFMLWMTFLAWHVVILTNQYVLPELPKLFGML